MSVVHPIRQAGNVALAVIVVAGMLAPLADWKCNFAPASELAENRVLAVAPDWPKTWASVPKFTQDFDAYWRDVFGFRRTLIRGNSIVRYELGVSPNPAVLVGKDNWLIYAGERSDEQHRGLLPFTEGELKAWSDELDARSDWLAKRGIRYLFVVGPDKQSIYPDKMPTRLNRVADSAGTQFIQYMAAHSKVKVLDLRPKLSEARQHGDVYSHTDTHWNDRGAFIAHREIMGRLREWFPDLTPRPRGAFEERAGPPWSGDLAMMLGLVDFLREPRIEYFPRPRFACREVTPGDYRPPHSTRYTAFEGKSPQLPRAVFFHDSFFLPPEHRGDPALPPRTDRYWPQASPFRLAQVMAENFSYSSYTWQHVFDPSHVERERPNVVVQEVVERAIRFGPQGAAPRD